MSNIANASSSTMNDIQNILLKISIPYSITVALIGVIGNVLTIIMLSQRSLTKNFNNCTLIALGLADLLFNSALLSRSVIDIFQVNPNNYCQLLAFVSHLAELLSACFTAHFTIQRFIAVRFPLGVFVEKTSHFLHYVIVTLFVLLGISFCLALVHQNSYQDCHEELDLLWLISDALTSFVIPFTIIAVLNLLIIFHLRKTSRKNLQLSLMNRTKQEFLPLNLRRKNSISYDGTSQSKLFDCATRNVQTSKYLFSPDRRVSHHILPMNGSPQRVPSTRSTTRPNSQSHRVTRMLILVSTCFLVLNAPAHICTTSITHFTIRHRQSINNPYLPSPILRDNSTQMGNSTLFSTSAVTYQGNLSKKDIKVFKRLYIMTNITQHISYLSYSINFFLYSFCGIKFRRELMKFFRRNGKSSEHAPGSNLASNPHST